MALLRLALIGILLLAGHAARASVGFDSLMVPDGEGPPLEVLVWYPTDAAVTPVTLGPVTLAVAPRAPVRGDALPLVVISHGNGSSALSHADTAMALAAAGFVVAAPNHTGDTFRDQSRATDLGGRTRHLALTVDHVTTRWNPGAVDPGRIGAFGFSAGAFSVLALAGGEPELGRVGPHCAAHPDFFDCRLLATRPGPGGAAGVLVRDARVRALVVAAPALGFTFSPAGLTAVSMPVQLWIAAEDRVLPPPFYGEAVRSALPRPPETHIVERAGHFDFLMPCTEALARLAASICESAPGFDRAAFHERLNAGIVRFLTDALRR